MTSKISAATIGMAAMAFALVAAPAFAAPTILGSAFGGPTGAATLYSISPTTGAANPIGAIGFQRVSSLDFSPAGVLYGIGTDASGTEDLLTINPTTGAGTLVGPLGIASPFQDMAFRNSDGALYAYSLGNIFTISPTTGAATLLGSTGVGFQEGDGLAFSPADILYTANQTDLETIDQSTGQATSVVDLTYPVAGSRANGMKFDKATGTLYASVVSGSDGFQANYLATIDIATGLVSDIGPTVTGLDAIAIGGTTPPPPTAPEPATLALLGAALAAMGLFRRGRPG